MSLVIRPATVQDTLTMAKLGDIAGEGVSRGLWSDMARPDQTALDVGQRRAESGVGSFIWQNASIVDLNDVAAGMAVSLQLSSDPIEIDSNVHPVYRPIYQLSNQARGTWMIQYMVAYPEMRDQGIETALLKDLTHNHGANGLSTIISDSNTELHALYREHGFHEVDTTIAVLGDWDTPVKRWHLLVRD